MNEYIVGFVNEIVNDKNWHKLQATSHFQAAVSFLEIKGYGLFDNCAACKVFIIGPDKVPYKYILTPKYSLHWEYTIEQV